MPTNSDRPDGDARGNAEASAGITLAGVTKRFDGADGSSVTAVDHVSLTFREGEWVHLLGPNGSGKSTLLRIVLGEVRQDEGTCDVAANLRARSRYVEQGVSRNLVPSMTVLENMLLTTRNGAKLFPSLRLARRNDTVAMSQEALTLFGMGLERRLAEKVGHLSGGQQQAIVAARALASRPRLLLLDEFTSALDLRVSQRVLEVVRSYADEHHVTVLAVTHDLHQIEGHGDRIVVLDGGRVKSDTPLIQKRMTAKQIAELVYG
jgi:putative ABC transport system ATP-binding protein